MNDPDPNPARSRSLFHLALGFCLAAILLRAILGYGRVFDELIPGDNDDMMRLMSVRDWLAGQGWFDMSQHRVLSPEGLSLHWSRYLDAGIAAILVPLKLVVPADSAERLALTIWPSLLLAAMVLVVGRGTWRLAGAGAAAVAMGSVMLWVPISTIAFRVGRIDHHSAQMLLATITVFAIIWPGRPLLRGLISGAAAAASLTVGLEMVPVIAVVWTMLAVRSAVGREGADALLAGFSLAIAAAAPLLMAGQTPRAEWLLARCDELATPVLALVFIGAVASLVPLAAGERLGHPALKLGAMLGLALAGIWMARSLLMPCLGGPYGNLPEEVQVFLAQRIAEAQPGLLYMTERPRSYAAVILPMLVSVVGCGLLWLFGRRDMRPQNRDAMGQMLVFGLLGLAGSFSQIRLLSLAVPAVPFLTGILLAELYAARRRNRTAAMSLMLIAAAALALTPDLLAKPAIAAVRAARGSETLREAGKDSADCKTAEAISGLNRLPPSRLLTSLNLGTPLLVLTPHTTLSAPYHRSLPAFWNGTFAFQSEGELKSAAQDWAADYVVLCQSGPFAPDQEFVEALAAGQRPDWLVEESSFAPLLVLKVDQARLEAAP